MKKKVSIEDVQQFYLGFFGSPLSFPAEYPDTVESLAELVQKYTDAEVPWYKSIKEE